MQFAPLTKAQRAEWQEMLSPATNPQLGVAALLFLFSAIAIPLSHIGSVAMAYLAVAAIAYLIISHSLVAVLAVALPAVLAFGVSYLLFPAPLMIPTVYAGVLMGAVSGAFLLVHCRTAKKRVPLLLLPLIAYLLPTLLIGHPLPALAVLAPTLLAIVLAYCVLVCKPLTPSVILLAITVAVLAAVAVLVALAVFGFPQQGLFRGLVDFVRAGFTAYFNSVAELYQSEQAVLGESPELYAAMGELLNPSQHLVNTYADTLSNIIPGLFMALCLAAGFAMWRVLIRMLSAFGSIPKVATRLSTLTVSAVAAVLFLVTYVLYLLSGDTLLALVCFNIAIVLTPALALVGFSSLIDPRKGRSCLSLLLAIGIVFLLMQNLVLGISLAAFVGAFHTLLARFMPPYNKGES